MLGFQFGKLQLQLYYKAEKSNAEADALSHIPWDRGECETLDDCTVRAIMPGCCCKVALLSLI